MLREQRLTQATRQEELAKCTISSFLDKILDISGVFNKLKVRYIQM